jgi:hypothetical protein
MAYNQRWQPSCNGCALYSPVARPWAPVTAGGGVGIVYPSMPPEDWASRSVDWHDPTPGFQLAPLLRCPGSPIPDVLSRKFRGEVPMLSKMGLCQMDHIEKLEKIIILGEGAFKAAVIPRMPYALRADLEFGEVWGSVFKVGAQDVYVAVDWQNPQAPSEMVAVDKMRVDSWLNGTLPKPPDYEPEVIKAKQALKIVESLRGKGVPGADIETAPGFPGVDRVIPLTGSTKDAGLLPNTGHIRCVGFGMEGQPFIVPEFSVTGQRLNSREDMAEFCKALCRGSTVWHNAPFDLGWLEYHYGVTEIGSMHDTRIMHRHVYEACPHSLAVACSLEWYTGAWKTGLAHGMNAMSDAQLWKYCGLDVSNTARLYKILRHYMMRDRIWLNN